MNVNIFKLNMEIKMKIKELLSKCILENEHKKHNISNIYEESIKDLDVIKKYQYVIDIYNDMISMIDNLEQRLK